MTNSKTIKIVYPISLIIGLMMILTGVYSCVSTSIVQIRAEDIRNIAIDTLGMLVAGVLILGLFTEEYKDRQNRSMFVMLTLLMVLFFLNLGSSQVEGNSQYIDLVRLVNTLAFIGEDLLAYSYWTYIRAELGLNGRILKLANLICRCVIGVSVILDIFNMKFGYYYTVSEQGEYVGLPLEFVGDIPIIVVFLVVFLAILYVKEHNLIEKLVLLSFIIFPMIAYWVGILTHEYLWMEPSYLLSVMLIYIRVFSRRGKKLAEQQVLLTKQSTALMISQIQPHFLYNVLTTISNLCATDPEEAEETTVLFSQYLRTNLDSLRNQDPVPFAMELSHIKTYVELEKKRFGEKLNAEYDIKESGFKVPSLGIQPIVENSIKHGIRGKDAPGTVKISSYMVEDGYMVVVEDDGIGFDTNMPAKDDGRSHVGMINVKERLRQMCNASVNVVSSPGNGCRTEIFIPKE